MLRSRQPENDIFLIHSTAFQILGDAQSMIRMDSFTFPTILFLIVAVTMGALCFISSAVIIFSQ